MRTEFESQLESLEKEIKELGLDTEEEAENNNTEKEQDFNDLRPLSPLELPKQDPNADSKIDNTLNHPILGELGLSIFSDIQPKQKKQRTTALDSNTPNND